MSTETDCWKRISARTGAGYKHLKGDTILGKATVFDYTAVDAALKRHGTKAQAVIAVLQDVQEYFRYLPREVFPYLSREMGLSEAGIYSVATFYENFSLEPKGKYVIRVCDGTACHVRKSVPILERLRNELGLTGDTLTTDDRLFTVETVRCLGACGLAPVITVNGKAYPAMTPDMACRLVEELREEAGNDGVNA